MTKCVRNFEQLLLNYCIEDLDKEYYNFIMTKLSVFSPEFLAFVRYGAITGFICVSVLIINLNHKLFNTVFRDSAKRFWWLFVLISLVPFLVIIYIFNFFFGGKIVQ